MSRMMFTLGLLACCAALTHAQTQVKDLKCPSSTDSNTAGGYRPANLTQAQLIAYAPLLAIPPARYLNENITNLTDYVGLAKCGFLNGTAGLNETVDIYRICSQVVAGTNYIFQYTIDVCDFFFDIAARIFVPLPSSNNTAASVTAYSITEL